MADQPKVIAPAFFFQRRRVGLLQKIQYVLMSNDGHEVVDAGTFFTDGRAQGTVSADMLCPVTGLGVPITASLLLHQDVVLQLGIIDGKIHKLDARVEKITFDGEVQNGKLTGKVEFFCKTPQVSG